MIDAANADPSVRFIVLDAPVLLEAGWQDKCDKIAFVDMPQEVRRERLAQRGWSPEQIAARERAQLPLDEKARRSDGVLDNSGSVAQTRREVERLLREWNLG